MGHAGPDLPTVRRERAWSVVEDQLRLTSSGLSGIALVDRLVEWGFPPTEAMRILQELQQERRVELVAGRWVLAQ